MNDLYFEQQRQKAQPQPHYTAAYHQNGLNNIELVRRDLATLKGKTFGGTLNVTVSRMSQDEDAFREATE